MYSMKKAILEELYSYTDFAKRRTAVYQESNYNLTQIKRLLYLLDNPQKKFLSVHVAGTKGKGSVVHTLSLWFKASGFKVGSYFSPHLIDERERFVVNNKKTSWSKLLAIFKQVLTVCQQNQLVPTVFDIFTASAFLLFDSKQVEVAIVEVGMGGRLDSTNVLENPLATVITTIGMDHVGKLGNTLKQIASEKAGIIKIGVPCFFTAQQQDVNAVVHQTARQKKATLFLTDDNIINTLPNYLIDALPFQQKNACLCLAFVNHYNQKILPTLKTSHQTRALKPYSKRAEKNFYRYPLLGRMQRKNNILYDVAHNPLSFQEVVRTSIQEKQEKGYQTVHVIAYFYPDKQVEDMVKIIPRDWFFSYYNLQLSYIPSALQIKTQQRALRTWLLTTNKSQCNCLHYTHIGTLKKSVKKMHNGNKNTLYIVCGSFALVGYFLHKKVQLS